MSEQFPADPAAITAHALRIFSYQSDLEHASATLRQVSASDGAFGLMAGPLIAPLFQLVEVGEHLAISGAECASISSVRRSWPARAPSRWASRRG